MICSIDLNLFIVTVTSHQTYPDGFLQIYFCMSVAIRNMSISSTILANPVKSLVYFSDPVPCDSGQYSLGNATSCLICPAGYKCVSTSSVPEICPVGTFSTLGQFTCQVCARGFYCPQEGTSAQVRSVNYISSL